jgi:hypothetical protein
MQNFSEYSLVANVIFPLYFPPDRENVKYLGCVVRISNYFYLFYSLFVFLITDLYFQIQNFRSS